MSRNVKIVERTRCALRSAALFLLVGFATVHSCWVGRGTISGANTSMVTLAVPTLLAAVVAVVIAVQTTGFERPTPTSAEAHDA
ncbi:hypothetical protein MTP99_019520 [Tenebrio molitor]|jgi:uncharacterized membrane protein|nr:hypothetical protein MTP99_019520 [Tenebrio molitor]